MPKFTPAPEVEAIAKDLIPDFHEHLANVRIDYVFQDTVPNKGGKAVWGSMRKISSLPAYLAHNGDSTEEETPPFFCMVISLPVWEKLDDSQKRALVDHELCHGGRDEEGKVEILPHDVEEFSAIIERHGLWRPDLSDFFSVKPA